MNHPSLAERTQELVTKAFVLEALTDKPGCTTRYHDLDGRPLEDFMMAGINSGDAFGTFAAERAADPEGAVFGQNLQALVLSNRHKSDKFVNFGLLEIMFPTVAARLQCDDPERVVEEIVNVIKETGNEDVMQILAARRLAWSTSQRNHKTEFKHINYGLTPSVWAFYGRMVEEMPEDTSHHQWARQYQLGLPILKGFFDGYQESGEIMHSTRGIFEAQRQQNPEVRVGILADMCAAAIYLWLSYNDKPVAG